MMQRDNLINRMKSFFDDTDIRALVFAPPTISFSLYIIILICIDYFSDKPVPDSYLGIGLGLVSLISCVGGMAQIYKREMPWLYGNTYKGNLAVVSGILIVFLFGVTGITAMIMGLNSLSIEMSGIN